MSHDVPAQPEVAALPPEITVLIPAFNEEPRLGATLDAVLSHPALAGAQLVVIDDGSTDRTVELALGALRNRPNAHILMSPSNKGKGAAVRKGVVVARGRKVLVLDAGRPGALSAAEAMLARLDDADVVVGAPPVGASLVSTRWRSGLRGFRAEVSRELFKRSLFDGLAVDAEILLIAQKLELRIAELPLELTPAPATKARPLRDAAELARMRLRHRGTHALPSELRAA
ncbi:MAG: glycosyltransferase [Patulibacter minatonensis]